MIQLQNVSAGYHLPDGTFTKAVCDVTLQIADGEFVAIMGRNGSGKTTLARLMNGLVLPAAGNVVVDQYSITPESQENVPDIRRRVGMVFQNPENQIVSTTVEREIAFGLENLGLPREEMRRRVAQSLRRFDLSHYRDTPPHRLSGGEMQRLAIASVLAMAPRHLILDEATSLLDIWQRRKLMDHIRALHAGGENHTAPTILFITQFPEEALFADRLLILHQGALLLDGPPQEIFLREHDLHEAGLQPPVEFLAFLKLHQSKFPVTSVGELLLHPIL